MGTWLGLGAPVPQGLPLVHRAEPKVHSGEKRTRFFAFDDALFKKGSIGWIPKGTSTFLDSMLQLQDGRFQRAFSFPVRQPGFRLRVDRM
jgi:hypothetical protein